MSLKSCNISKKIGEQKYILESLSSKIIRFILKDHRHGVSAVVIGIPLKTNEKDLKFYYCKADDLLAHMYKHGGAYDSSYGDQVGFPQTIFF